MRMQMLAGETDVARVILMEHDVPEAMSLVSWGLELASTAMSTLW